MPAPCRALCPRFPFCRTGVAGGWVSPRPAGVLAGNKVDLADQREVDAATAKRYADEIGALFLETSAKENTNVSQAFEDISTRLKPESRPDMLIDPDTGRRSERLMASDERKSGCC